MEREDEEEDDIGHLAERRGYTDEWVREMARGRSATPKKKKEEGGKRTSGKNKERERKTMRKRNEDRSTRNQTHNRRLNWERR